MPRSRERWDWLDWFEAFTRLVNRAFAAIACLLVLVIMALIVVAVFYRYVLHNPIAWVLDITIFLLVFVFFLAVVAGAGKRQPYRGRSVRSAHSAAAGARRSG